ncbi:MAG: 2'-5' RNA ligase family protein [Arachnia sp.]
MTFTHTIACDDRDFPEWHGGCSHALVWALELDQPDLVTAVAAARARLEGLLLPLYDRQPHVTVAFGGLAEGDGVAGYGGERLTRDLHRLRPLLDGPVELRATGWGSFPMVPYLAVESPWLQAVHDLLDDGAAAHGMSYMPHVTVGHWAGAWRRDDVLARLDATPPAGPWRVGALSLLRYETHDIAGALEVVGRLDLTDGTWHTDLTC